MAAMGLCVRECLSLVKLTLSNSSDETMGIMIISFDNTIHLTYFSLNFSQLGKISHCCGLIIEQITLKMESGDDVTAVLGEVLDLLDAPETVNRFQQVQRMCNTVLQLIYFSAVLTISSLAAPSWHAAISIFIGVNFLQILCYPPCH